MLFHTKVLLSVPDDLAVVLPEHHDDSEDNSRKREKDKLAPVFSFGSVATVKSAHACFIAVANWLVNRIPSSIF